MPGFGIWLRRREWWTVTTVPATGYGYSPCLPCCNQGCGCPGGFAQCWSLSGTGNDPNHNGTFCLVQSKTNPCVFNDGCKLMWTMSLNGGSTTLSAIYLGNTLAIYTLTENLNCKGLNSFALNKVISGGPWQGTITVSPADCTQYPCYPNCSPQRCPSAPCCTGPGVCGYLIDLPPYPFGKIPNYPDCCNFPGGTFELLGSSAVGANCQFEANWYACGPLCEGAFTIKYATGATVGPWPNCVVQWEPTLTFEQTEIIPQIFATYRLQPPTISSLACDAPITLNKLPGSSADLPNTITLNPITTNCAACGGGAIADCWAVTVSGVTNQPDDCNCNAYNTATYLSNVDQPPFNFAGCNLGAAVVQPMLSAGATNWTLTIGDATYTLPINSFNCNGSNVMNFAGSLGECLTWPATVTIAPSNNCPTCVCECANPPASYTVTISGATGSCSCINGTYTMSLGPTVTGEACIWGITINPFSCAGFPSATVLTLGFTIVNSSSGRYVQLVATLSHPSGGLNDAVWAWTSSLDCSNGYASNSCGSTYSLIATETPSGCTPTPAITVHT